MLSSPVIRFRLLDINIYFATSDEDHIPLFVYFARICKYDMDMIERHLEMAWQIYTLSIITLTYWHIYYVFHFLYNDAVFKCISTYRSNAKEDIPRGHPSLVFVYILFDMMDAVSKANKFTNMLHLDLFHLSWSNDHAVYEEWCDCVSITPLNLHPLLKKNILCISL